ncbi:MAG: sigma-70 family RNA polymerase sigma factor [Myxococcota bacterium]|nr:sigma-70 family RNA polymerase sigma factor [Myxococcota bacterium]
MPFEFDDPEQFGSDTELAAAAASGNADACWLLVERLLDRVSHTVRCLAANDPDADDYVQDAFIEILKSIGKFQREGSLDRWAETVAIRVTMRRVNKRVFRAKIVTQHSDFEGSIEEPTDDLTLTRERIWRRIVTALEALNPERRLVVVLRHVLGYSIAEIASKTEMNPHTVRDRLKKGRAQLREAFFADKVLTALAKEIGATK